MDWSSIQGRWDRYKFAARRRWAKLSEHQLHGTRGERPYLLKRVQEAYSLTIEEAEREVSAWQAQLVSEKCEFPRLYLIQGGVTEQQRRIYRLRQGRSAEPAAQEPWPKDGEWRKLIRRLMKNPVKP